jgi:hypothetical protein
MIEPLRSFRLRPLQTLVSLSALGLLAGLLPLANACTPAIACDPDNPGSCPSDQVCDADTAQCMPAGDGDGDGDGDPGDGDGDGDPGDGDGDGDGDVCTGDGVTDCDGDGVCEYLNQNPNHCGMCGNACTDGACSGGVCQSGPLLENLNSPWYLELKDGYVYFTEHGNTGSESGAVRRFPVGNPNAIENLAAGMESPRGLAFTDGKLFFFEDRYQIDDALWQTDMAGPPTTAMRIVDDLSTNNGDSSDPVYGIGASNGYVFYMDDQRLYRRGIQSGVTDEVNTGGSFAKGLLVDDSYAYFVYGGVVYRIEVNFTTTPEPEPQAIANLPDGHTQVWGRAQSSTHLYFGTNPYDPGGIVQVAKDGSTTTLIVSDVDPLDTDPDDSSAAYDLAVDATHIYYCTGNYSNRIWKLALTPGSTPELLAEADDPSGIAVDDEFVYWTEFGEGTIMRKAKN